MEIWKSIKMLDGFYQASSEGRIRRAVPGRRTRRGTIIKPRFDSSGYLRVSPWVRGKQYPGLHVHRLVAEAFIGPRPNGLTVDHIDGDKLNNRPENLRYLARAENVSRSSRSRPGRPQKLTLESARQIKSLIGTIPNLRIARRFGVSDSMVGKIARGKNWQAA